MQQWSAQTVIFDPQLRRKGVARCRWHLTDRDLRSDTPCTRVFPCFMRKELTWSTAPCRVCSMQWCSKVSAVCPAAVLLQVALEGAVNAKLAASSLARGELPQGDLIPWTMGQQFQVSLIYCSC